jgi:outer membrane protein OmpA-like peptidoglycan-associated protein
MKYPRETFLFIFILFFMEGHAQQPTMDFENYDPESTLVVPEHILSKARYPFIDVHSHHRNMGSRDLKELVDPGNSSRVESLDLLKRANSELIFFDLDDSGIRDSEIDKMDSIVAYLYNHKRAKVLLTGHADQLGTDAYNLELSRQRVERVKSYFENKGIPSRIMQTRYFGESKPIESHPRGEESQVNRRVEVMIVPLE